MSQPTPAELLQILDREANRAAIRSIHEQATALQTAYDTTLHQIETVALPPVRRHGLRAQGRKAWASEVRHLLKELKITGISVTAPNYSMASSITIRLPRNEWEGKHKATHDEIEVHERGKDCWLGFGTYCPFCKRERQVKDRLETIILAAYPDLADRSDLQSDYFDSCFTIE